MLTELEAHVSEFFAGGHVHPDALYNEASLQHELAIYLRAHMAVEWRLFLEKPVSAFHSATKRLTKKEIDIAVQDTASGSVVALELKCPRQGQHPEQMFKACQDLEFLEQLVATGFAGGIFIMHVRDPLFYQRGSRAGIYEHFRAARPICGVIGKPTGRRDVVVSLVGSYSPQWQVTDGMDRYWIQSVAPAV